MKLREIAHCRTGDKGDFSCISVIAYDPENYERIQKQLTVEVVKEKFSEIVKGNIVRHELPNIHAFVFDMAHALGGGVTRTLAIDPHGKSLCFVMLYIDIE
jgi:hypothetical protein